MKHKFFPVCKKAVCTLSGVRTAFLCCYRFQFFMAAYFLFRRIDFTFHFCYNRIKLL